MTCSGRLRSCYSSRVGAGLILIDFIMLFFCWYVISISCCASAAPSLASLSAFLLPGIRQCDGIHCMVTLHLMCRSGTRGGTDSTLCVGLELGAAETVLYV
jgi:hypothetical protein